MDQGSLNSEKLKQMHQFLDNELQGLRNLTVSNNLSKDSGSNQSSRWQEHSNLSLSQLEGQRAPRGQPQRHPIQVQPLP